MSEPLASPLFSALTDVGLRREENQDAYGCFQGEGDAREKGLLLVVADGMGGHQGGATASRMAVDTLVEFYRADPAGSPAQVLEKAFLEANRRILHAARNDPELTTMGTTCTALALVDGHVHILHVGDTRAYLIREGQIERLTVDQTWVQEMADQGMLSRQEIENHPDRNVLTQALGMPETPKPVALPRPLPVRPGDIFLLCTDGLSGLVQDDELLELTLAAPDLEQACRHLVDLANARGGHDNITVLLLQLPA